MDDTNDIKVLFLGDITGKPGRSAVKKYLLSCKNDIDFVIANVENASHGFGLTEKNYNELLSCGIDCMTSGNHIWDKKDIYDYINDVQNLVRPINYPNSTPGTGSRIFEIKGEKIGVINVLGQIFMPPTNSPWQVVIDEIRRLQSESVQSIFVDFHAEATAEKICFSKFLANEFNTKTHSLIKGFLGTHTHVMTADEKIIQGMAYITDVGFCGSTSGVIGMDFSTSLKRLSTYLPERYDVAQGEYSQVNGVEVIMNKNHSTQIKRINLIVDYSENKKEVNLETSG